MKTALMTEPLEIASSFHKSINYLSQPSLFTWSSNNLSPNSDYPITSLKMPTMAPSKMLLSFFTNAVCFELHFLLVWPKANENGLATVDGHYHVVG